MRFEAAVTRPIPLFNFIFPQLHSRGLIQRSVQSVLQSCGALTALRAEENSGAVPSQCTGRTAVFNTHFAAAEAAPRAPCQASGQGQGQGRPAAPSHRPAYPVSSTSPSPLSCREAFKGRSRGHLGQWRVRGAERERWGRDRTAPCGVWRGCRPWADPSSGAGSGARGRVRPGRGRHSGGSCPAGPPGQDGGLPPPPHRPRGMRWVWELITAGTTAHQ